jgi:hypothetical protein
MHNTDRTQQYLETPGFEANFEGPYQGEFPQGEYQGEVYGEYPNQGEYEAAYEAEYQGEYQGEFLGELINPMTGEINQEFEMQLAAELLSVSNEAELDQFLGKLVRGIGRGFKKFARSGFGRALGGVLKKVARVALPIAGKALGSLIPIPGVGTALGGAAANALGGALGLEFEGLSHEDREFEIARRIVRIGIEGARAIDNMPEGEYMGEQELLGSLAGLAGRFLPGVGRAILGGVTGQAATGGQGSGGLGGGFNISSPGGWNISAGGQAGGQGSFGSAVGINTPAPTLRVPRPGPIPSFPGRGPGPRPGGGAGGGGGGVRPRVGAGRWIRRGRSIIVLGAF